MKAQPASPARKQEAPSSIHFTGRLILVQSIGFLALAIFTAPEPPIVGHEFTELWRAGLYISMAFLSAWAGIALRRLRPTGWNLAMLVQGVALLQALVLYTTERPPYIYVQMLLGILIVLNLNQAGLRRSFPTELIEESTEELHPAEAPDEP